MTIAVASKVWTINELFGVGPHAPFGVAKQGGPFVPVRDDAYQFREELVRCLMIWHSGIAGRNLLVQGPTGAGKSSLIEQFAARIGQTVYRVPCHGRSEFSDFTGQLTVKKDGSTEFVLGALPRAMKEGGILLFDEFNFLPPSVSGALNTVLDGGPLLLPETGEIIYPAPTFRVAATGNAVDGGDDSALYRGTQRMNLAMIQRFLCVKVGYLSELEEAQVLHKIAPSLHGNVIKSLLKVANDVRQAFARGDIETTVSTRTLTKLCKILDARKDLVHSDPMEQTKWALRFVLLDGIKAEDASAIEGALLRVGIDPIPTAQPAKAVSKVAEAPKSQTANRLVLLVNKDRQGSGNATHWGFITDASGKTAQLFNGGVGDAVRYSSKKTVDEARATGDDKVRNRGYAVACTTVVPNGIKASDLLDKLLVKVLSILNAYRAGFKGVMTVMAADLTQDGADQLKKFAGNLGLSVVVS
jgi:cobaltochelatase CobS